MKRTTLILTCGGALGLAALAFASVGKGGLKIAKAEDTHSTHTSLKKIGFDWKDPTQDGYMPYYRCTDCCALDPSSSRFSIKDGTTAVSETDITILSLTTASDDEVSDTVKNIDQNACENLDQIVENDGTPTLNATYVADGDYKGAYFSRSRDENGDFATATSSIGFSSGLGSDVAVTSVTFFYRYKNWSDNTGVNAKFAYESTAEDPVSYSLNKLIFNDGEWHTLTLSVKDITGEDSVTKCTGFGFEFPNFQGYMIVSNLAYGTESVLTTSNLLGIGSSNVKAENNDIADFSVGTVEAYADEDCSTSISESDTIESLKKAYVKIPLSFSTITTNGRVAQDSAVGRLTLDIDLDGELLEGASVKASLKGFAENTWFGTYMTNNFIDQTSPSSTSISEKMDTAISQNGIYALVSFDFSNSNSYALRRCLNAFSISATWSAYNDSMTDFTNSVKPVAYITGDNNGWSTSNLIHQMVPDLTANGGEVTWVYKNLTGFGEIKVVHNGGWNGCRYVEPNDYVNTSGNAFLTKSIAYNVYYITGESTFYVKLA